MDRPETRYAWNGDVALAYQVVGSGPVDLIYLEGYASHVDINWEGPSLSLALRALAGKARLIVMDRRGYGRSDRFSASDAPPLEELVDDILVVMDAAGSERAAVFGTLFSSVVATLFAATHPDRAAALILQGAFATYSATEATPWMVTPERWNESMERIRRDWGTSGWIESGQVHLGASWTEQERDWFTRWCGSSIAPGAVIAETRAHMYTDITMVLPSIQVPCLVLVDVDGTRFLDPRNGRYIADHIPGATVAEYNGGDGFWWSTGRAVVLAAVGELLDTIREEQAVFESVLATILFTDIVGSTDRAAELGDVAWGQVLERHHATLRSLLARFRGREMDTAGDGFFATFDGPARAIRCALAIVDAVEPLGIEIRAGVHTGECDIVDSKVGGLAVSIGARVAGLAGPSQVLISQTVKDLVAGSGLAFEDAGEHELKGVPDRWHLYRALG